MIQSFPTKAVSLFFSTGTHWLTYTSKVWLVSHPRQDELLISQYLGNSQLTHYLPLKKGVSSGQEVDEASLSGKGPSLG